MFNELFNFFKTKKKKPQSPTFRAYRNKGYEDTSIEVEKPEPYVWLKCPPKHNRVVQVFAGRSTSSSSSSSATSMHETNQDQRDDKYRQKARTIPWIDKQRLVGRGANKYNSSIGENYACVHKPHYNNRSFDGEERNL